MNTKHNTNKGVPLMTRDRLSVALGMSLLFVGIGLVANKVRRIFLFNFSMLLILFSCSVSVNVQAEGTIKVLMIEGVSNHDWRHRSDIIRTILDKEGSFDITMTITPSVVDDPAWDSWRPNFSEYDVVMSGYNNLGRNKPSWPKEVQQAFERYLQAGGGFYVYHEANNAFKGWPEYNKMIGLGWRNAKFGKAIVITPDGSLQYIAAGKGKNTGHGPRANTLLTRMNNHPIHSGLPDKWMAADLEVYRYARGPAENVTVMSYATDAVTSLQFPTEWVVQYGAGHSYVSTYGHVWKDQQEPEGIRCVAFQTIMVRALKWLAGKQPDSSVPDEFPTEHKPSLRPYARTIYTQNTSK